ncbi:UDP-N-acetylmuramate dehydrogenase [Crocinitomicaceae bacterium]|nr:UDP-N-acetylmuramate dehydrogenase [Crocinitomicaceae bacterium]
MMINNDISLKAMNTFGIDASAKRFTIIRDEKDIKTVLDANEHDPIFILGGGSNILFTQDFDGLVIKNEIQGFNTIEDNKDYAIIESGAGEVWHEFVMKCIDKNLGGIENLSLIPGNVGASPMQNIGAYGVEIKDVFEYLDAYHIKDRKIQRFNAQECKFGYRESVFKNELKGQYIICKVAFRLTKKHDLKTSYGAIENELRSMNKINPSIRDVSDAVINIRQSKLPDPKQIGNAGSFFKNPIVSTELLNEIQSKYADIPNYPATQNKVKLAAGWLIEKAGWKGRTYDERYGVHKLQALVLVNYNRTNGDEILKLSALIIEDVKAKFNVTLEREVNIL